MADFNKPSGSSVRTAFMQEIRDAIASVAKMFNGTTDSNLPDGSIKYNATSKKFEIWSTAGASWSDLDVTGLSVLYATSASKKNNTINEEYIAATGAANTYAVTLAPVPTAYYSGMRVVFMVSATNTGASTLNVNGLGAKSIKRNVSLDCVAGDLPLNYMATVRYDGTNFQLETCEVAAFNTILERTAAAGVTVDGCLIKDGGAAALSDGANIIKTKIIAIGDWDMDSTAFVNIAHGLDVTKIRSITAIIYQDDNGWGFALNGANNSASATCNGSIQLVTTNVSLIRTTGGYFDNTAFNATSYNRGWIVITYVV